MYFFIEAISQLYRSLITIQPWVFYLMQSYEGSEKMVGMFLTSVYGISKVVEILVRLQLFKNATWTLLQSVVSNIKIIYYHLHIKIFINTFPFERLCYVILVMF